MIFIGGDARCPARTIPPLVRNRVVAAHHKYIKMVVRPGDCRGSGDDVTSMSLPPAPIRVIRVRPFMIEGMVAAHHKQIEMVA